VGRPGVQAITPESAIMMPESAITMPGIADHHAGTSDHDGLEWAITFDWNARSQWAGLRTCPAGMRRRVRGRPMPVRASGISRAGVPKNTLRSDETPKA
jgi:hypothetical protein